MLNPKKLPRMSSKSSKTDGVETGESLAPQAVAAEAVVDGPLFGVGQDAVGFGRLLEPLLRLLAAGIAIGMVLQGQLSIGLLDVLRAARPAARRGPCNSPCQPFAPFAAIRRPVCFRRSCFHLRRREPRGRPDLHLLLQARLLVLGRDLDQAVGVDLEGDVDLGHAGRGRLDADELEDRQGLVHRGQEALALEDVDADPPLVVLHRREGLDLAGRDGRVPLDDHLVAVVLGLDAQGERRHVEQEDEVADLAVEDPRLDGRAHGDDLVGIDLLLRLAAEELGHPFLDQRHPGLAADEDDVVDPVGGDLRVGQRPLDVRQGPLDEVGRHGLERRPAERLADVIRFGLVRDDERQVDLGLRGEGQLPLGLLRGLFQPLEGQLVRAEVDAASRP